MQSNKIIHETSRLKIMTALVQVKKGEKIDFSFLKKTLKLSDGNLSAHLSVLEKNGYLKIKKLFVGKKPKTFYSATPKGREAFTAHINYLKEIIKKAAN